jgi:hypothetical protein
MRDDDLEVDQSLCTKALNPANGSGRILQVLSINLAHNTFFNPANGSGRIVQVLSINLAHNTFFNPANGSGRIVQV